MAILRKSTPRRPSAGGLEGVLPAGDGDGGGLGLAHRPGAGEQCLAPEPIKLRFKRRSPHLFDRLQPGGGRRERRFGLAGRQLRIGLQRQRKVLRGSRVAPSPGCGLRLLPLAARVGRRRARSRACDRDRRNRRHEIRSDAAAECGARGAAGAEPATSPSRLPSQPGATAAQSVSALSAPSDAPYLPLCPSGAERAGVRWGLHSAGNAYLTLPSLRDGSPPSPPEGRRGHSNSRLMISSTPARLCMTSLFQKRITR
jgi:hypothetical protein